MYQDKDVIKVDLLFMADDQEWQDAASTCAWNESILYDVLESKLSVQVKVQFISSSILEQTPLIRT